MDGASWADLPIEHNDKLNILCEIINLVNLLDKVGIQSVFIALEPSAKELHTAASSLGQEFIKANNLIELFVNYCSNVVVKKETTVHCQQIDDSFDNSKTCRANLEVPLDSREVSIQPSACSRPDGTMAIAEKRSSTPGHKQYRCDACNKVFMSEGNLNRHRVILHENKKLLSCNACGKKFSMLCRLKQHMVVHSEDLLYGCEVCSKRFKSSLRLSDHAKIHASSDVSCRECGKKFARVKYLKRHMITHTGKEHLCQVCGKQFAYPKELLRHMALSHGDVAERSQGSRNKDSSTEDALNPGFVQGSTSKRHDCVVCGKSFGNKTVLNTHMVVHSGERRFRCDWCGQRFKLKGSLRGHIRTKHTGDKPHSCSVCGRSFAHVYQLKCHKSKHDLYGPNWLPSEGAAGGSGSLTCAQCGKPFSSPVSLWGHMSAHTARTSLKQFACGDCDKKFARHKSLRRHCRNHHRSGGGGLESSLGT